ncbi:hypothetical protein TWF718_007688 [Orbilia javanica]|uniref:Uncharacterized protein n=1 Tax=Orbilia javanica TaxID=47235 RepID=A0AAN8N114_9PEZI
MTATSGQDIIMMDADGRQGSFPPAGAVRKRARSPSSERDGEDHSNKTAKLQYSDKTQTGNTIDYYGSIIRNATLGTLGANGKIEPLLFQQPTTGTKICPDDLPTPGEENDDPRTGSTKPMLPENFVVTGDMKLFGMIDSQICIFPGLITPGQPYTEIVTPSAPRLSVGDLVPRLKGSPMDSIALEKTRYCYSEISFDRLKRAGLYVETDVLFQGTLQPVQDTLRDFFGQGYPHLHMSAYLGQDRNWALPLPTSEIVLTGSLDNVSVNIFDILTFTKIGVEVSAYQAIDPRTYRSAWQFGFGFFGHLNMSAPGSIMPLQVEYQLQHRYGSYMLSLTLQDDEWKDIFGVKGLNIKDVQLTAVLSNLSKDVNCDFKVEAALNLNKTDFLISGTYSKSNYRLEAFVGNLTLHDVGQLFTQVTGATLDVFDHDVTFNSIYVSISSDGLVLSGAITVNGYSTAQGTIAISRDGLQISGGIGHVEFEHFIINDAMLDVFVGSTCGKACTRATKFSIVGDLTFSDINLKVGLFTSKAPGSELKWTIFGQAAGDLKTSKLCSDLQGTFLDVSLNNLAFIASNDESPAGDFNHLNYPLTKGIQFCAMIDSIPELESLMRGSVKGMVIRAAYSSGKFSLGIILPGERTISFGDHIYTGPLQLEIQTGTDITLVLKALLNVKVDTQPTHYELWNSALNRFNTIQTWYSLGTKLSAKLFKKSALNCFT